MDQSEPYASLRERVIGERGVVMVMGTANTGKTTMSRLLLRDALDEGRSVAFVDADVAVPSVGAPACVALRWVRSQADLDDLSRPDAMRFVGSTQPQGVVLPHVVATATLVEEARKGADFIVLDTSSVVSGVVGQTLTYHVTELCDPNLIIAMQRGEELEPGIGMLRRFLGARIAKSEPPPGLQLVGPLEQRSRLIAAFRDAFEPDLQRWRVHSSVFAPTLPEAFDLSRLEGMLVGVLNETGACLGLGALEHDDGVVRVATRFGDRMRGLRLGSLRIDLDTYETSRVRLRQLIFGI
ncbi:MAG: Clp1/GlmU family protein [Acidimicrobiia bacterium]|nr:Clp1/GlmU family protein [Acidimicrobiia bacterium]MDX2466572.1 Clp1/GlmU family protein [Acidimicrobiia bacterium]